MTENLDAFKGIIPAFYACYDKNGEVDTEAVKELTSYFIRKEVKGIYVCGSSGECIYQSVEDRKKTLEAVMVPVVALVGRPNVGKSTLFNRLTRTRDALVADFPGLTRDRKYGRAEVEGREFICIDTGGIDGTEDGVETRMLLGFVGLGAVVETAYLPAIRNLFDESPRCSGFDVQPVKQPEGVTRCASLAELLSQPLDTLFITTASLNHLEVLEQAIASPVSRIVVEKPIVATLPQIEKLKSLLELPGVASRVLALDHWMARLETVKQTLVSTFSDVVRIEGFLQEPSGYNPAGEPIALNFATGESDTRTLHHPDGVILDIGTHVYRASGGRSSPREET